MCFWESKKYKQRIVQLNMNSKSRKTGNFPATIFLTKNRRGSHVGMIISFVIFITFIVFLYVVVNPAVSTGESKKSVLDFISNKITENISANFTTVSVDFTNVRNPNKNCIILTNLLFNLNIPNPNIIAKNATESIQEAYEIFPSIAINRKVRENRFFKVYHSSEFDRLATLPSSLSPPSNCKALSDTEYTIGSVTIGAYAFENNTYELINYYKNNYDKLKQDFDIVPGAEFGFDFIQYNGTIISVGQPPTSVSIYAEEIPMQYIDSKANILSGFINIKVW